MHHVGLVLHPKRDSAEAVEAVLSWAASRGITVLGLRDEIDRLNCAAVPVTEEELGRRADLIVSLGGDGTMLRAMRLADRQRASVLGVNLGKLGFLAEVDVPDLPEALSAIGEQRYTIEARHAIDATLGTHSVTAFNDVVVVRVPGNGGSAQVAVHVAGHLFVSYAADAVIVATPTGSTAYSFSAGGPIVHPGVEALLVTPAAPHSAYNRGFVLSVDDAVALDLLPASGRLAIEVDGQVRGYAEPGDRVDLRARPGAARVIRLGHTTFYERARRKLRLTDSAEIPAAYPDGDGTAQLSSRVSPGRPCPLPARPCTLPARPVPPYPAGRDLSSPCGCLPLGRPRAHRHRLTATSSRARAHRHGAHLSARAVACSTSAALRWAGG
jgi:NAD+ kinase